VAGISIGNDRGWRVLSLGPAVAIFVLLTLLPIINLIAMSFHDVTWVAGNPVWTFVASRHFEELPGHPFYFVGLKNTLVFAVTAVTCEMILGFFLALLVSKIARGRIIYLTIFLLPIVVPPIVIGAIWKLMYSFDFGVINQALGFFGMAPVDWLGNPKLALASVIVVDIWHWTPFVFLLMLAAIESLPQDVFEAARIDGAGPWQELLPLLLPTIGVTLVFRMILAFKVFDEVYLLTGGGPGTATEVLSFSIYRTFFAEDRVGLGSVMSIVALLVIALVAVIALSVAKRREAES
jgi:multiple sugar transport system permease protein